MPSDRSSKVTFPTNLSKEVEMFFHCEVIKENIVLRTETKAGSNVSYILGNIVSIYYCCATRRR